MTFDSRSFSKDLKIARYEYQYGGVVHQELIQKHLAQLVEVDLTTLVSDEEKTAFWINVYNGMINYAMILYEVKQSMKDDPLFFKHLLFKIGALSFSLDDIEHGILRRNARNHIETHDPKLAYTVTAIDYRIHFALNCGAHSCPAIAFYTVTSLKEELVIAETSFVSQEFIIDDENQSISCSSLFEWYKTDFGNQFLQDPKYNGYRINLKEYDWSI